MIRKTLQVYIAGTLTSAPDLDHARTFYEFLGQVCREAGYEAFIPHLHSDPERHPAMPDTAVYQQDRAAIEASCAIIADLSHPSTGLGAEIGEFRGRRPILGIHPWDRTTSRYITGLLRSTPGCRVLPFRNPHECRTLLLEALSSLAPEPNLLP